VSTGATPRVGPAESLSWAGRRESGAARRADTEGVAVRGGVRLAWASHGTAELTIVLLPTWSVVPSRVWKAQVAYLARHFRVVTFDGRGSGASDRPTAAVDYTDDEFAADTVAVMDAAGVDAAVLVGFSCGVTWALQVAADHPERVLGLFALSPSCNLGITHPEREESSWDGTNDTTRGWAKYNRAYWRQGGYPDFLCFFFSQLFSEPHSLKQIEDGVRWGLKIDVETAIASKDGRAGYRGGACEPAEPLCARVRCPVMVMHGTDDRLDPHALAERLAELTGGSLLLVQDGSHGLLARQPVRVNHAIREFVERLRPPPTRRGWVASRSRPKRVLYISSPIGLGHARRDAAIADELRLACPGLQVDWLAQHPLTRVLADRGERVHPASRWLANESSHIEGEAGEHDLHVFAALRRMDAMLLNNFHVFADLVERTHYDLVVGDEAWEVDHFLHENPELKRSPYAWLTDFVGWLPMPDGGPAEAALTSDLNAQMLEQRARYPRLRDRSVFVGNPADIVEDSFGEGLPAIAEWTRDNFDFAGYVTGIEPSELQDRRPLQAAVGHPPAARLCVVTVGGSGVGAPLLHRVLDAIPIARRLAPDLRFLVVCGPRIDPRALPAPAGTQVVGYLPDLHERLAACDVAVVQGGLTTCMELTAARRPFVYVPLEHHFEQTFHVRRRLARYGAGLCLEYRQACDPHALAAAIVGQLDVVVDYLPVETDGARNAAALLAELL
jgi:pimeloyl-ACP methyl ester carboxylesterase/predicted glycosyltransferase